MTLAVLVVSGCARLPPFTGAARAVMEHHHDPTRLDPTRPSRHGRLTPERVHEVLAVIHELAREPDASAARAASRLRMSTRTLSRILAMLRWTYPALRAEMRKDDAQERIRSHKDELWKQAALNAGFSHPNKMYEWSKRLRAAGAECVPEIGASGGPARDVRWCERARRACDRQSCPLRNVSV